jgi:hypothetical protein
VEARRRRPPSQTHDLCLGEDLQADGMQDKSEQWLLQRVLAAAELATET